MIKKAETKKANEDNNNKYNNYFLISPPPADEKSQDQHFQSSSSPVGRPPPSPPPPPPPPEATYNYYQHSMDNTILEDLSDIISQDQLSPRTPPLTPFMMMSMGIDFVLDEFLDSSYSSDVELFPALPNNSNESS